MLIGIIRPMARSAFQHFLAFLTLFFSFSLAACRPGVTLLSDCHSKRNRFPKLRTPTATPIPMALTVNGEGITTIEFDTEVDRLVQSRVETW